MIDGMVIGQLAASSGLSVRTLRFYSDAGVLPEAGRTEAGYRLFGPDAVARARLVRTMRDLGVGLDDIKRVLTEEASLVDIAAEHARALDAQISTLRLQRAVLRDIRSDELAQVGQFEWATRVGASRATRVGQLAVGGSGGRLGLVQVGRTGSTGTSRPRCAAPWPAHRADPSPEGVELGQGRSPGRHSGHRRSTVGGSQPVHRLRARKATNVDLGQAPARTHYRRMQDTQGFVGSDGDQQLEALADEAVGQVQQPVESLTGLLLGIASDELVAVLQHQQPPAAGLNVLILVVILAQHDRRQVGGVTVEQL